jgi:hypothetical protein
VKRTFQLSGKIKKGLSGKRGVIPAFIISSADFLLFCNYKYIKIYIYFAHFHTPL